MEEEDDDYFREDKSMKDYNYDQEVEGANNEGSIGYSTNSNIVNQNINNNLISVSQVDDSLMVFDNSANNDNKLSKLILKQINNEGYRRINLVPYHGDEYTDFKQQSQELYQPPPPAHDNYSLYDRYNSNRSQESNYRDLNFEVSHISSHNSSNTTNLNNNQFSSNNPQTSQLQQQLTIESSQNTKEYELNNQVQRLSSIGYSLNKVDVNSQVIVEVMNENSSKVDQNMANAIMNDSSKSQALSDISSTQYQNQAIQKLSNISEEQQLLQQLSQEIIQDQLQDIQLEELKKQIDSDIQDWLFLNKLQQISQTKLISLSNNQEIPNRLHNQQHVQLPDMYEHQLALLKKIQNNEHSPTSLPEQTSQQPIAKQRHNSKEINKYNQESQLISHKSKQRKFVTYYKSIDEAKKLALYAFLELDLNNHQKVLEFL